MADNLGRSRTGGRVGHAGQSIIEQMPWRLPVNPDRPTEPLDAEGVAAIHNGAIHILSEIGIRFLNDEALAIFRRAGCAVDGNTVRMDSDFVMEMLGKAPDGFTVMPRNPAHTIAVGGRSILFGNVSSPPNYWDLERGRVTGFMDGFRDIIKLTQYFNCIHFVGGYPVEPVDVPASIRHLACLHEMLTLTDKVCQVYAVGGEQIEDGMELVRIAGGLSDEDFRARPRLFTNINSVSPLKHDFAMIDGALRVVRSGQAVIVTPYTLAGAVAPVTMAGAVTLSIAEALSAIALLQFVAPGAPVAIGTFASNVDMRSGAPAFGTPEYMRATQMAGQMARFYGLPLRSSGACAAKVPDGQAMWETCNSLWAAMQSGSNVVNHAAGWLEGGLVASPEKFLMDCEVIQMMQRYMEPRVWATSPDDIAIEAIREVGAEGNYFGCQHTRDRHATAFYQPIASDWRTHEAWQSDGSMWTVERAHETFKSILAEFEAPPMDAAIRDALEDFVARRRSECGVSVAD